MARNLPLVAVTGDFQSGPPSLGNPLTSVGLHSGNGRSIGGFSCSRGRSYELGQTEAGECSVTVEDPEETLNPVNTSSPLNSGANKLALYRSLSVAAWWPREGNALQAGTYGTTYHPGFELGTASGWSANGVGGLTNVTTAPRSGTRCIRFALNGPSATALKFPDGANQPLGPWCFPGRSATYSCYLKVETAGVSARISFGGQLSAIVTTSASWTRVSVTVADPTARTPLSLVVTGGPAGNSTQVVFLDDEQLEFGVAAPSTWTTTGPVRYPVWTGFIERYPQEWVDQGFRGVRPLECVDALSVLAQTVISDTYATEVLADNPSLYVPLDDASGPGRGVGQLAQSVQFGEVPAEAGGSINWGGDRLPDGSDAVSLSQQLQDPADLPFADQATGVDPRSPGRWARTLFALDTGAATISWWAKVTSSTNRIAFQSIRSGSFNLPVSPQDVWFGIDAFANGQMYLLIRDGAAFLGTPLSADATPQKAYLDDGRWHFFAISFLPDPVVAGTYRVRFRFDNRISETSSTNRPTRAVGINSILAAATTFTRDPLSKVSVARFAYFPQTLTNARLAAHYNSGSSFAKETSTARAIRLLDQWWGGTRQVFNDPAPIVLASDERSAGSAALGALESVAQTTDGVLYTDRSGVPTVESSVHRHEAVKRTGWVFGEGAGELPYDSLSYDFDPSRVYSRVSVTRPGRSEPFVVVDPTVEAEIGRRVLSRTLDVESDFEVEQAAIYPRSRYRAPRVRVRRMVLRPDSKPELWPFVLSLEISQRVTVRRRTRQGTVMQADYYVEHIAHDEDVEASTWTTTVQMSPVWVDQAWVLGDATAGVLGTTTVPVY